MTIHIIDIQYLKYQKRIYKSYSQTKKDSKIILLSFFCILIWSYFSKSEPVLLLSATHYYCSNSFKC